MTTINIQRNARHATTLIESLARNTETVATVFRQLGAESRRRRFGIAKNALRPDELALLATAGSGRVVLVARASDQPVGIAHLARDPDGAASAKVAVAVADRWQGLGVGTALAHRLATEATAAGIVDVHASIAADNRASLALLRRAATIVETRLEGADLHVVAHIPARGRLTGRHGDERTAVALKRPQRSNVAGRHGRKMAIPSLFAPSSRRVVSWTRPRRCDEAVNR
jgi:GNAT superfamily N-acetyltransferase